ncbi:alpha/beta fold hydrolase [Lysinibacillus yapensis]|uniref:Alpha/beta fold hydrolase n=1 Tax=Ureibacillus yapensis TaxID=2304605 RepID=A0A396S8Q6_9BACL|nr:alpha/beta hydrolase [Lysinibacillus yapensis]RHW37472.1 alpha/beta fold hydrolase [Lysinibacillus yapensis]
MAKYETKRLRTGDFETVYCEAGTHHSETIFFLHGSGPGATAESNWKNTMEVLGEKYHVIAPDLVGFGNTEIPENTNLTFWQWTTLRVQQVLNLMDHYNIETTNLVGNSMGGIISLNAVMQAPDKFKRLVLMGSGGGITNGPTAEIVRMTNFFKNPTIEDFRNLITYFMYDEKVVGDQLEEIVRNRYEVIMKPDFQKLYPTLFPANPLELLIPVSALKRITQPVLLIHGYEDQFVPKESSLSLVEHLPNAELVLLKQCGHWVQIEKAERFIQLVDQFLGTKNALSLT